ncbi:disease resistance protein RPV1-like [Corylus avellana]|uniref:disease resistance protein RPV1-like n=1 Tax=Corylus avellana TaxID=13451 RepID=UPI00286BEFAA|nr:disease resistance protein RPV1-like [Corylus avellana]
MDQIISVIRRCLPFCFPLPESEDQNEASQVVEEQNEDVRSSSSTTSTSFSKPHWNYDVFLSFSGKDTRKNFTDHLYSALEGVGIRTFRDDKELQRGKPISTELRNAIHGSRISIVVFSKDYASSWWCLDELVEIVNCKNTIGHTLLPIFYHVAPSDVRKQIRTFAKAFSRHKKQFDMERIKSWRKALTEAANCSGWDLESVANGYESRFIKEIVEEVLCKVNPAHLDVAKHPIGMGSRVRHIKDLLNLGTSDVCILGIYGMGGMGKTTLAKAVYNEICVAFEGSSFLPNIKESLEKPSGLVHLQEQLLNDILKKNLKIGNVDRGINIIKERIHGKKFLVILDDVDDFEELHKLVEKQWFGPGSRIIVTTRDEQLLTQLEVHKKYKVEELNNWESLRLFSYHAFGMALPINDYQELSISAVKYSGGLPLALVILGSFLKGRSIDEWKSKLEKLQSTPHDKIQKILRISFDSLDSSTKDIFLDVACFFVGIDKEYAIKILDGCNFSPGIGIPILIQMSLVTIDYQNKLKMHNLIRDMGREIVREESPKHLGKRSRLWFHKDVSNVLDNRTGSKTVEGLILNLPVLEDVHLKTKAFSNMKNLRLLQINSVYLTGSYEHLSKELKWLCWHKCPMESLPQDFHLEDLVVLDMQNSNVEQVWKTKKRFNKLKVLNLSNSKYLTKSPDFSQVPQLEILILEGCTSLVQVHESIGYLKGLVLLNLQRCKNLRNLPSTISNLQSLETLLLSKCFNLQKLPEQLGHMTALTKLCVENICIKQLPSSFILLKNLETLSLRGCDSLIESPEFLQTSSLKELVLEGCTSLVEVHESIGLLKRLIYLNLGGCKKLRSLPSSISNLELLETLELSGCLELDKLPEQLGSMMALTKLCADNIAIKRLPSSFSLLKNLETLSLRGCDCLIESPEFLQTSSLKELVLEGCISLVEVHESIGLLTRLLYLNLGGCKKLRNLPSSISNLEILETLELSDCLELDKLPEQLGKMKALKCLHANRIATKQQPSPGVISLSGCGRPSSSSLSLESSSLISLLPSISEICALTNLTQLVLDGCNLSEDEFPIEFECLFSLMVLDLSRNNFRNLPSSICRLPGLRDLSVHECTALQSISFRTSVPNLGANGCTSLERILIWTNENSGSFYLHNCHKLIEIQRLKRLQSGSRVVMGRCNNLSPAFRESVLQMMCKAPGGCFLLIPGSEIPSWFGHQTIGSLISFRVPWFLSKIGKVLLCVVYAADKEVSRDSGNWAWRFCNKTRNPTKYFRSTCTLWNNIVHSCEDHIFVQVRELHENELEMKSGDEIELFVKVLLHEGMKCEIQVKKLGIHLLFDELNVIDEAETKSAPRLYMYQTMGIGTRYIL